MLPATQPVRLLADTNSKPVLPRGGLHKGRSTAVPDEAKTPEG